MRTLGKISLMLCAGLVVCGSCELAMADDLQVSELQSAAVLHPYQQHEWRVASWRSGVNPFDPASISVDGLFTAPDGRKLDLPAFWDQRPAEAGGGNGNAAFYLRFAPDQPGNWTLAIDGKDAAGGRSAKLISFQVAPPAGGAGEPGFIRRAANNRYFRFDSGQSYFAIGLNLCWPEGKPAPAWYETAFTHLQDNGGNFARIWLAHPPTMLESDQTGLGKYSTPNAAYFDQVLGSAQRHGIRVMLCFLNHRELLTHDMWGKAGWETSPYNAANGGPATRPVDFFTSPEAIRLMKARLRYIVARYAAFTSVGFWELFNEQENAQVEIPLSWNRQMVDYLRQVDPYKHLVTTSATVPDNVWQLSNIDLTQTHIYGDGNQPDMVTPVVAAERKHEMFHKPHLVGEMGIDFKGPDNPFDPKGLGTGFHNSLWSAMMSGNAGTAMYWWWDYYIAPMHLWGQLKPVADFAAQVDWAGKNFRPIAVDEVWHAKADAGWQDLTLMPAGGWGDVTREPVVISPTGRASAAPSRFMCGPSHTDLHAPLVMELDLPQPSTMKLGIGQVSDYAVVRVLVDDRPVRDFFFSALPGSPDAANPKYVPEHKLYQSEVNHDDALSLDAGHHRVTVDVAAGDWITISHITFTNVLAAKYAHLRALAVQDPQSGETLLWILDTRSNWKDDQTGQAPPLQDDVRVKLPAEIERKLEVTWWDTRSGRILESMSVATVDGALTLRSPYFSRDIAVRVK